MPDPIASAAKIGRLAGERDLPTVLQDEAVLAAILFNLQIIGESVESCRPSNSPRCQRRMARGTEQTET